MFERGRVYVRRELHNQFGGQDQGGISTPAGSPIILLFTGEAGRQYGYNDGWEAEGTFRYFGEGQRGDMRFVRGNRAIRDHGVEGKELHLFEKMPRPESTRVRYEGQFVCAGYEFVQNVPDLDGMPRTAIAFRLAPLDRVDTDSLVEIADLESASAGSLAAAEGTPRSLEALRERALAQPIEAAEPAQALRTTYQRSLDVRRYVLLRAAGVCEGCDAPAPFVTRAGTPYLEPHHTRRLSDGGPDHPAYVIALCPNCHRRAHHAIDGQDFNDSLIARLRRIEQRS